MQTVTYKSVLDRIASYLGEADGLTVDDKNLAGAKINLCVRLAWQMYFWPELTPIEERTFRPAYDAAENVVAGDERFFANDGQYYQALVAQSPATEPPAELSGGSYAENSAFWALSQGSYSGPDHADATFYAVGTIVRNPNNRRFYQCIVEHTSVSADMDLTKFGILTPFTRSIDYEQDGETPLGEVRYIWDADPRYVTSACRVGGRGPDFRARSGGIQVLGTANVVYLEFRLRPNVYSGATRSDTATYAAGVTVYDSATEDYWTSNASIAAGESPTNTAAKWDKVEFPYIFAEYVAQSVYAMLTNKEQELPENFNVQRTAGYPLLLQELDKIERQQGQTRQLNVVGR